MSAARDPARALAATVARAAGRPGAGRTLFLDLDGTLAPIAPTPESARVPDDVLRALRRLVSRGWRVAVVSGRPAAQVRRMVPVRGVRAFGSHGFEGSWTGRTPARLRKPVARRLQRLEEAAAALARRVPGSYVERKPAGIALHDRNVATGDLRDWRRRVQALLQAADLEDLEVLPGRRVIEVRACGYHKGRVVQELLEEAPRRRDDSLLAVGDDRTDEDMFRALRGIGLAVRVGPPRVRTLARRRLPSPRAVARFLTLLAASAPPSRRPGRAPVARKRGR